MFLSILYIFFGIIGLIWSSNIFIDNSSNIAKYYKVSPLIVGILVVGIGSTAPESLVSFISALKGTPELALGNAIGANIVNISLVIGISAILIPITIRRDFIKKEFFFLLGVTFLVYILIQDGYFSRFDSVILLLTFAFFIIYMLNNVLKNNELKNEECVVNENINIKKSFLLSLFSLSILIICSNFIVEGAVDIAMFFNISEVLIGLTILAVGTTIPELSTTIVGLKKKQTELVIGNIIGANIFNLILALPIAGIVSPFVIPEEVIYRDFPFMIFLTLVFLVVCYSTKDNAKINKIEGLLLLFSFILYQIYLIYHLI